MLNYEFFIKEAQPTELEIREFVETGLFEDLDTYLRNTYNVKPKTAYSNCSMDNNIWRGWNVKYQKSGKSLCTIYPQKGYFLALVPGSSFEIRDSKAMIEVKLAVETRVDEINIKKIKHAKATVRAK